MAAISANTIALLVQIASEAAPPIISAIQAAGGTVQSVGPILDQDAATIAGDIATLQGEQTPPTP